MKFTATAIAILMEEHHRPAKSRLTRIIFVDEASATESARTKPTALSFGTQQDEAIVIEASARQPRSSAPSRSKISSATAAGVFPSVS